MKAIWYLVKFVSGAGHEIIAFDLFRHNFKVYSEIVHGCKIAAALSEIIRGRASIESIISTDYWRGYYALVDIDYEKTPAINHSENEFVVYNRELLGLREILTLQIQSYS